MSDRPRDDHDLSYETEHQRIDTGSRLHSHHYVCGLSRDRADQNQTVITTNSPTDKFVGTDCRCGTPADTRRRGRSITLCDVPLVVELEQERKTMRAVIPVTLRNLKSSGEEQAAINEEALSGDRQLQSMKKELFASRSEVQSLKQELTALKSQMLETLKPQPKAAKDLQNARHSPAGARLFLPMSYSDPLTIGECHPGGSCNSSALVAWRQTAANHIAGLTRRQREVMELVLAGRASKNIAAHLGISQRTVENHRASIMKKTGSKSLPALTRLALFAAGNGADDLLLLSGLPIMVLQHKAHS